MKNIGIALIIGVLAPLCAAGIVDATVAPEGDGHHYRCTGSFAAGEHVWPQFLGHVGGANSSSDNNGQGVDVVGSLRSNGNRDQHWTGLSLSNRGHGGRDFDDDNDNEEILSCASMVIPEPATMAILGFGALALLPRKK